MSANIRKPTSEAQWELQAPKPPIEAGNCTICQMSRLSKHCRCMDRIRVSDPFLPEFDEALQFIEETRFFGNEARDDAYSLIHAARREFYAKVADGTMKDGNILKRVDRDAERLKQRADGRLYATRQKMAERPQATREETIDAALSNVDKLRTSLRRGLPATL